MSTVPATAGPPGVPARRGGRVPPLRRDAGWLIAWALFAEVILVPIHLLAPGVPALVVFSLIPATLFIWSLATSGVLRPFRVSWVLVAWTGFTASAAVSLHWSSNPAYGSWKLGVLVALGLLPGLMARVLVAAGRPFSWRPLGWLGAAFLVLAFFTAGEVPEYPGRMTLPGGNPIWLGRSALIAAGIIWGVSGWSSPVRVVAAGVGGYLAFASGSRGPMAAGVLLLGMLAMREALDAFRSGRLGRRGAQIAGAVTLAVFAVGLGARGPLEGIGRNRIVTSLEVGQLGQDENLISRRSSLDAGVALFADNVSLGAGLGGFAAPGLREYPHNLLVEVGAELGLVGLLLLGLAFWASIRVRRGDGPGRFLMTFCGVCALVSGDLGTNAALVAVAMAPSVRRPGESR